MKASRYAKEKAVLYGGEGCVNIFRSDGVGGFCSCGRYGEPANNLPTAIIETVDPIVPGANICEKPRDCYCCFCCVGDIPDSVCGPVSSHL